MEYNIEKNIPMLNKSKGENNKTVEMRKVLAIMEKGDSFIIQKSEYYHLHNAKKYAPDLNGRKFTARKLDGKSFRVWRVE